MASKDTNGQMLLLAGILIVLAFILLSIQLSMLPTLGQQTGRQLQKPLTDEYSSARRGLEGLLPNELRNSQGVVVCPTDLTQYRERVNTLLDVIATLAQSRGHLFGGVVLTVTLPTATQVEVKLRMVLSDGTTTVADDVAYKFSCT